MIRNSKNASTGNRTRTARVAGEHSTIEPSMLTIQEAEYRLRFFSTFRPSLNRSFFLS